MDGEIERKYEEREQTIITENNKERIPLFVESVRRQQITLRPVYQRRAKWTPLRQSRLIESLIMNIPVPPIFMYETTEAKYEVVDGQQRITALIKFYADEFELVGLRRWPELNGRRYSTLPPRIKAAIDRRSLSSIVLMFESAKELDDAASLKQEVFERLNTGGVHLHKQEVRNSLYSGKFNNLIRKLARNDIFAAAWDIPKYIEGEDQDPSMMNDKEKEQEKSLNRLYKNPKYRSMMDVEFVLRFFSLRHIEKIEGNLNGIMDKFMRISLGFEDKDLEFLEETFLKTLATAKHIYGTHLFRAFIKDQWTKRPYLQLYDAVMVGISRHLTVADQLVAHSARVLDGTKQLLKEDKERIFTGQGKKRTQIEKRIAAYDCMLTEISNSIL